MNGSWLLAAIVAIVAVGVATAVGSRWLTSSDEDLEDVVRVPSAAPFAAPHPSRRRPDERRARWNSFTLVVIGAVALVALGAAWSLASPIGASPDDDFHLATIWCDTGNSDFCRKTGGEIGDGIRRVLVIPEAGPGIACYAFRPTVSASCQAGIEDQAELVPGRANDGLYPGGFHRLMSLFASEVIGRSVLIMRMASWLLAAGLLVAAAALAHADLRRAFSIALLTTVVPLGMFLFASNNPSGLAVAAVAAYWCAAQAYMGAVRRDRAWTVAVVMVIAIASLVALASRSDSGLYLGVASLAAWISTGGYRRALWRRSVLLVGVCLAGALGTLTGRQAQAAAEGLGADTERTLGVVLFENAMELPRLVFGSLGTFGLGWLDTALPGLVSTFMLLALGGAVVVGMGVASREKCVALAAVTISLVAIPMAVLAADGNLVGENVQPRYVLPLLPVLVGTALIAPRDRPGIVWRKGQALLIAALVVLAHSAALHTNIRRYVTGVDVRGLDLGAQAEWWWGKGPGPLATWLIGSIAFAVIVGCALLLFGREAHKSGPRAGRSLAASGTGVRS